jgi:hypothetical protein
LRVTVATAGGWLALQWGEGLSGVFLALGCAIAVFGTTNAIAIACGVWFRRTSQPTRPSTVALNRREAEPARAQRP